MSDMERDPRVAALLEQAADEVSGFIRPAGVSAVVSTVRTRRRVRLVGLVALALVAVSAPAAVAGLTASHKPPAPPGVRPSTSAVPERSDTPPPSATDSPVPRGGISPTVLRNATLEMPPWPPAFGGGGCESGSVRMVDGKAGTLAMQGEPIDVDVDHDGWLETVQLFSCAVQGYDYKVLALKQDTGGRIATFGQVVGSASTPGREGVDIMTIWGLAAGDNGQVRVDVGEYRPCCAMMQASQHQWRTYGWNGQAFTQTGGPTTFGTNPRVTDLVISAGRLAMTRQADGSWRGDLQATIRNAAGFATPGPVQLFVGVGAGWQAIPVAGSGCQPMPGDPPRCRVPVIAKGASRVVTVQVIAPAGTSSKGCQLYAVAVDPGTDASYPGHTRTNATTVPVAFN